MKNDASFNSLPSEKNKVQVKKPIAETYVTIIVQAPTSQKTQMVVDNIRNLFLPWIKQTRILPNASGYGFRCCLTLYDLRGKPEQ